MDKVGVDDELRCGAGEVGGVPLPARQGPGLGLQFPVDARGGPGELDVAVALDRGFPLDSAFGLGDLFVDAAQRAPRPVAAELVVDDTVGDAMGLLAAGGRLGLGQYQPIRDELIGMFIAPFPDHIGHRLEHQEIRPHRPPLPHREDQSRTPDPHRRRPTTRRPPRRAGQDRQHRCALVWPNSGRHA